MCTVCRVFLDVQYFFQLSTSSLNNKLILLFVFICLQGIAQLAGHNEGSRYELLEVSEPGSLVIRGEQCHVTEADCEELARLKTL